MGLATAEMGFWYVCDCLGRWRVEGAVLRAQVILWGACLFLLDLVKEIDEVEQEPNSLVDTVGLTHVFEVVAEAMAS